MKHTGMGAVRRPVGLAAAAAPAGSLLLRTGGDLPGPLELQVLPGAVLLLVAGVGRAAAEPDSDTWQLLGAGLVIGLGPSLLLSLADPLSLRTLVLGAAAVAVLVTGAVRRWQAPFLVGAGVLVLLALRFLGPLAASAFDTAVGPWLLFGTVGVALLAAGILWERTLTRVLTATHYLTALR